MASRIRLEDKNKPFLNVKLHLEIPFSISAQKSLSDDFDFKVANENTDRSKKLREFMFKKLNIRTEAELSKIPGVKQAINTCKDSIYKHMGVTEERKFSEIIKEECIIPYLNEKN